MAKVFPEDMVATIPRGEGLPDTYAISFELFDYLSERYAHAVERQVYNEGFKSYALKPMLGIDLMPQPTQSWDESIITISYGITDPRIIGMEERTLKNILLEGYNPNNDKHRSVTKEQHERQRQEERLHSLQDNYDDLKQFAE